MVEHQTPISGFWGHIPTPDTHRYLGGIGVVFSNDSKQLGVVSVSVPCLGLSNFVVQGVANLLEVKAGGR